MLGWHVSGVEGNDRRGEHYAKCEIKLLFFPFFAVSLSLALFVLLSDLLPRRLLLFFPSHFLPTSSTSTAADIQRVPR